MPNILFKLLVIHLFNSYNRIQIGNNLGQEG